MQQRALTLFLALGVFAGACQGQSSPGANMAGKQEAVPYRQGVGRILWIFPPGWTAVFAVPHWTAGARVLCSGKDFDCEVQVLGRDITVSDAERRQQLEEAIDALAMWALRLGDYRATCETRFPAYREANDRAYAASPFAAVDVMQAFRQLDPSEPEEAVRHGLAQARHGFAQEFDLDTAERRRAFCEGFPRWVQEAARDL
jgi:hypothetical protein